MLGLLLNWFDVAPGHEAEFDNWHNREHVPERLGVPGFRYGRRLVSLANSPPQGHSRLVMYDGDELATFASDEYAKRLNSPTPLTRSLVPHVRDMTRTAYEVVAGLGGGIGAFVATVRLVGSDRGWNPGSPAVAEALRQTYAADGVTAVRMARPDPVITHFKDATAEGRQTHACSGKAYPWSLIIEASGREDLEAAVQLAERSSANWWAGAGLTPTSHTFRLVFALGRELPGGANTFTAAKRQHSGLAACPVLPQPDQSDPTGTV